MREMLFIGKRTDTGEWVEGFYSNELYANKHYISKWYYGSYAELQRFEVIPETVGQYTGVTDNNGKRIFEGYIVAMELETTTVTGAVKYQGAAFYIATNSDLWEIDNYYTLEVIGNIHDNPDLLK